MGSEHTLTPWKESLSEGVWTITARDGRDHVCFFCAYGRGQGHSDLIAEATANAHHIPACVNAFHDDQGRTLESPEQGLVWRLIGAMQEFCDRVERGEVRSRRTYRKFKDILDSLHIKERE